MADVVPVEDERAHALGVQVTLRGVGDRGLARARQSGEPHGAPAMAVEPLPGAPVDDEVVVAHVRRAAQGEAHHPGGHGVGRQPVHQHEPAGVTAAQVGLHRDRAVGGHLHAADVVEPQHPGGVLGTGGDVQAMAHAGHNCGDDKRPAHEQVGPAVSQGLLAEPHDVGGEPVGGDDRIGASRLEQIPAGHVEVGKELDGDGIPGRRVLPVSPGHEKATDLPGHAGTGHGDLVAHREPPGHQGAGHAAEPLGTDDGLHGDPGGPVGRGRRGVELVGLADGRDDGGPGVPVGALAGRRDVVAGQGADRDHRDPGEVQARRCPGHGIGQLGEAGVVEADRVELVHRDDHMVHAHQRADGQVPVGLAGHPTGGVHKQQRDVGRRGRDGHVAGVLLMAWGIGDHHAPAVGQRHVPVGHVDGDALLALGLEPVGEQGEVDLPGWDRRARPPDRPGQLEGVLGHGVGVGQQPADQGGLAVVDAAAGDQADEPHQKYPSTFLASIEAPPSPSIIRPARSDCREPSISAITSSRVTAGEATAALSG